MNSLLTAFYTLTLHDALPILILLIAENVLIIEETLYFYFPTYAILLTFGSFIVLFLVISIFVPFILRSKKIIELIKLDKAPKQEPKPSIILTLLYLLLLFSFFLISVYVFVIIVIRVILWYWCYYFVSTLYNHCDFRHLLFLNSIICFFNSLFKEKKNYILE